MSVTLMIQNELGADKAVDTFGSIGDVNDFLEALTDETNELFEAPLYIIDNETGDQYFEVDYLTWSKM